ncbi:MAG: hypothetical protein AAF270_14700 [Pseudomonadota bacterium]
MNYFEYNEARVSNSAIKKVPKFEVLEFTGDETIDVEEQGMSVAEIREFIRHMHAHNESQRNETTGNVVAIRERKSA